MHFQTEKFCNFNILEKIIFYFFIPERVKSLEKRNILPIKSDKKANTLKTSLKFKVVNKRETTEFLENEFRKINEENGIVKGKGKGKGRPISKGKKPIRKARKQ